MLVSSMVLPHHNMPHSKNIAMFTVFTLMDPSGKFVRKRCERGSQRMPYSCVTEDTKSREINSFHKMAMFSHQCWEENWSDDVLSYVSVAAIKHCGQSNFQEKRLVMVHSSRSLHQSGKV